MHVNFIYDLLCFLKSYRKKPDVFAPLKEGQWPKVRTISLLICIFIFVLFEIVFLFLSGLFYFVIRNEINRGRERGTLGERWDELTGLIGICIDYPDMHHITCIVHRLRQTIVFYHPRKINVFMKHSIFSLGIFECLALIERMLHYQQGLNNLLVIIANR